MKSCTRTSTHLRNHGNTRAGWSVALIMSLLLLCLMVARPNVALAQTTTYAIVHPDLESASGAMFKQMLVGIARYKNASIVASRVGDSPDIAALTQWSADKNPAALIFLGGPGSRAALELQTPIPKLIAGTVRPPADLAGVSMLGEPTQFFAQLKQLVPTIRNVTIINSPDINGWWITPAQDAAKKAGLTLHSLQATDVIVSARTYRDFLTSANPKTDALWIPLTDVAPIKTVLPLILRESWSRNIVVFSHNPLLVKQGVLFALYPDNEAMGYQVAELAGNADALRSNRVEHARKLLSAINRRTAAHLGLDVSEQNLSRFDRIYPVQ